MKNIVFAAALAAGTLLVPAAAHAQRGGILIVDTDRVLSDCTACRAANGQLQQREAAIRSRAQTLNQQLATEGKPLQDAYEALRGRQPDAALQQRITAFETKQRNAQQEIGNSQRTLQSTATHVQQQIGTRLISIVEQVRARRGAAIVVAKNNTIANDTAVDVTSEVLTALNQQLPAVSVTPLPQQQQQQQTPQGR